MPTITKILAAFWAAFLIFAAGGGVGIANNDDIGERADTAVEVSQAVSYAPPESVDVVETAMEAEQTYNETVELMALLTMAEAEGECEEGKRLVIDTVLNRVDSAHFPDTIYDVIYQPNQFSSLWNGRIDRCEVREDICLLVWEELESRTNYDVVFFNAGRYSKYGVPMFQVGNHYFSSYD
jgi:N-acetylmuramoyl-L-alanine amidase